MTTTPRRQVGPFSIPEDRIPAGFKAREAIAKAMAPAAGRSWLKPVLAEQDGCDAWFIAEALKTKRGTVAWHWHPRSTRKPKVRAPKGTRRSRAVVPMWAYASDVAGVLALLCGPWFQVEQA